MATSCPLNQSFTYYSASELETLRRPSVDAIFQLIIMPAIVISGLIINAAFVYVVYRVPEMRTITNLYLVQLSITDMGTAFWLTWHSLCPSILSPNYNFVPLSGTTYSVYTFLIYVSYLSGVNFIFIVTVERYLAICKPMKHMRFRGKARARNTSIACWVVGILLAAPHLVPYNEVTICAANPEATSTDDAWLVFETCAVSCSWCYYFVIYADLIQFSTVFVVNIYIYTTIIKTLRNRATDSKMPVSESTQQVSRDLTLMLLINGIAFFILLGPCEAWNIAQLINLYSGRIIVNDEMMRVQFWASRLCSSMNFCINPLIYAMTNRRYRRAFQQVLCRYLPNTMKRKMTTMVTDVNKSVTEDGIDCNGRQQ